MQGLVLPWLLALWALLSSPVASARDDTTTDTICYVVQLTEHHEYEPVTVDNSVSYSLVTTSIDVSKDESHILISRVARTHQPEMFADPECN